MRAASRFGLLPIAGALLFLAPVLLLPAWQFPQQFAPQSPEKSAQQAQQEKASISGQVFDADTGQPIKGAVLYLLVPGPQQPSALSNVNGAYEFRDLAPGAYDVQASRRGYVTLLYAEVTPERLVVRAGEQRKGIDLRLKRTGVITGTVTDEDGEPLSDVLVAAVVEEVNGMHATYRVQRDARTDDRGVYRITDLLPGRYYVRADYEAGRELFGYGLMLHPAARSIRGAQPVMLGGGSEASRMDIRLEPGALLTISGLALDGAGQPLAGAIVAAFPADQDLRLTAVARRPVDADGSFEVGPLPPGNYQLLASPGGAYRPPAARANVLLAGKNAENVVLTASAGVSVSGRVRVEGAPISPKAALQVTLADRNQAEYGNVFVGSATMQADSPQFVIDDLQPGEYQVEFDCGEAGPDAQDYYVREIRVNGDDATNRLLLVPPGSASHIEIVIDSRSGRLAGILKDDENRPSRGWILLESADSARRAAGRYRHLATASEDGVFLFRGVAPGEYLAIAWNSRLYLPSPELVTQLERYATPVRIEKEATARQDVRLRPEVDRILNQER